MLPIYSGAGVAASSVMCGSGDCTQGAPEGPGKNGAAQSTFIFLEKSDHWR